jgi:serine/threonine-protein kinase RsbT
MADDKARVLIESAMDIVTARQTGRSLAVRLGFDAAQVTAIAAAISEVSRNIVEYARCGEIIIHAENRGGKRAICIVARDQGPGIADVEQAMRYGYSSRKGLGVGLPGAKWLMDEFFIESSVGVGTIITMKKWVD